MVATEAGPVLFLFGIGRFGFAALSTLKRCAGTRRAGRIVFVGSVWGVVVVLFELYRSVWEVVVLFQLYGSVLEVVGLFELYRFDYLAH